MAATVRAIYTSNQQPYQTSSLSPFPVPNSNNRLVALGFGSHIEILLLNDKQSRISQQCLLQWGGKVPSKFTWTDVRFSPHATDANLVAASATNGVITVFELGSNSTQNKCKWTSGENPTMTQRVNRIAWHPSSPQLLASANMDSSVKLYDIRSPSHLQQQQDVFKLRTGGESAIRDVQFDPFDEHKFAALCDSGVLVIWDARFHCSTPSTSTSSPLSKFSAHILGGLTLAYHEGKRNLIATGSRDKMVKVWDLSDSSFSDSSATTAHRPVHVLHTPSGVGRICWRGPKWDDQLATTSSSDSGEILVWKLRASTAEPVCILRGHEETCTNFHWLDSIESPDAVQHMISVGKDGRMLIQDLRNGYFPDTHTSRCVTAISSHGHLAFHRGFLERADPLGLSSSPAAYGWFASSRRAQFGNLQGYRPVNDRSSSPSEKSNFQPKSQSCCVPAPPLQDDDVANPPNTFETGVVFCGLADISDLVDARGIRAERGAEGGVFDPAIISLLARSYVLGAEQTGVANSPREACIFNLQVAARAGLASRAAIWAALLSLLPSGPFTAAATESSPGKSSADVLPSIVPFGTELLGNMLLELLDGGDTQHFVLVCEVLRRADRLDEAALQAGNISDIRRREAYLAYFDLLSRLQLSCAANNIIKASDEEYISKLSRQGVTIHTACSKCGKDMPEQGTHPWCSKCRRCAALCVLCHKPVKGLMHWCPVCGHGGHLQCTKMWFETKALAACPSGCGHHCFPHSINGN